MTEPLTPEQARGVVLFAETFIEGDTGSYSRHAWTGVVEKLLPYARAYADQSERLKEIEEAVREMLPHYEGMETGEGEPCPQMARLRDLMEKK